MADKEIGEVVDKVEDKVEDKVDDNIKEEVITDEALDAAAVIDPDNKKPEEAEVQEDKVEEQEGTPASDEPMDHGERSQLGRKVANLTREQENQMQQYNALTAKMDSLIDTLSKQNSPTPPDDDEDVITTKGEMREFMRQENLKQNTEVNDKQAKYSNSYISAINTLSTPENQDIFSEIVELTTNMEEKNPYNKIILPNDPIANAEINFAKAEAAVYRKRAAIPKDKVVPLKGEKPRSPLGPDSSEKVVDNVTPMPKLDKFAEEFKKSVGMTDEEATESLTGDTPAYLGGR